MMSQPAVWIGGASHPHGVVGEKKTDYQEEAEQDREGDKGGSG